VGDNEPFDVVGNFAVRDDRRVEAAGSLAGREDIPQSDPRLGESGEAFLVREVRLRDSQRIHDRPECVLAVGVILRRCERRAAGHRTEDQHLRSRTDYGREASHAHAPV